MSVDYALTAAGSAALSVPQPTFEHADELPFHAFANIFPLMEGDDLKALKSDIRPNGLRSPIVVQEQLIFDGRSRFLASGKASKTRSSIA